MASECRYFREMALPKGEDGETTADLRFLQIVRLYLRGQEGAEDLKRPFKPGGPSFMAGSGPATDKASIEAAEKANLLYRKEEF